MANAIINTTSKSSLPKHVAHALAELKKDGEITLIQGNSGPATLYHLEKGSTVNKQAIKILANMIEPKNVSKLDRVNYKKTLESTPINVKLLGKKVDYPFHAGHVMKSGDRVEFGYLAESIVLAAMAVRFTTKRAENDAVTPVDIQKKLNDYFDKPSNKTIENYMSIGKGLPEKSLTVNKAFEYVGVNENSRITDNVYVYYALNDKGFNWLKSKLSGKSIPTVLQSFFADACSYVNGGSVKSHSNVFYTNGKKDRIDIFSSGVMGQGKTKADIITTYYVGYKGKPGTGVENKLNIKLSVKINNIAQVGQVTGISGEKMGDLTSLFNVPLDSTAKKEIDKLASGLKSKINNVKIQEQIYKIAYAKLQRANLEGVLSATTHFAAFTAAAAKELSVVDIGKGLREYFLINLNDVKKRLQGLTVRAEVQEGGTTNSKTYQIKYIVNYENIPQVLLQVNSRYAGGNYRNMVSTGKLLRTFLSKA